MRKSPLFIAIAASIFSAAAVADETNNEPTAQSPRIDTSGEIYQTLRPEELSDFDKEQLDGKRSAITGYLHSEEQLRELRDLLFEAESANQKRQTFRESFPFTPEDIRNYRLQQQALDQAEKEPLNSNIEFKIKNVTYNPDSSAPMVISLAPGYSAQIEFYDSSGKPWPISTDGIIGDGESFTKNILGEQKHIASFVLTRKYQRSNAAIILEGLSASIPVLLKGTNDSVDGRTTVTIPRLGPNAQVMPVFENEMDNVSPELVQLQGGVAPTGAKTMRVNGIPNAEAWYDGKHLYLSLPHRLLLPLTLNSSMSPTGRYLYKLDPTPYITASVNGERVGATIEGSYQVDIRRAPSVFQEVKQP